MQLLTGLAMAVITFTVMLFLSLVAVSVLPTVVLVAVPFVAMLACSDVLTAWQRSRLAAFSGVRIPAAAGLLPRSGGGSLISDLLTAARRLTTWRHIGYHLIVGPAISAVGGLAVTLAWAGALAFGSTPVQELIGPTGPWQSPVRNTAVSFAGLALFFVAPLLARGGALVENAAARAMLGPGRGEELARLEQSRASAVSAADTERRRIERDLHDGTQQRLVSMAMRLGLALATLEDLPDDARRVLERAHEDAKDAIRELRDLVQGLYPAILTDRGLDAALSGLAARAALPVTVCGGRALGESRPPAATEAVAFFIVAEALTNAAKHAAASQAQVTVRRDGTLLTVTVTDDGRGGADDSRGTGLTGLRQRAASVGGTLHIDSPPGGPTVITAELPCGS